MYVKIPCVVQYLKRNITDVKSAGGTGHPNLPKTLQLSLNMWKLG